MHTVPGGAAFFVHCVPGIDGVGVCFVCHRRKDSAGVELSSFLGSAPKTPSHCSRARNLRLLEWMAVFNQSASSCSGLRLIMIKLVAKCRLALSFSAQTPLIGAGRIDRTRQNFLGWLPLSPTQPHFYLLDVHPPA